MTSLPEDYPERVYAGVLGKLIGVYLGRPFEGWTHQRIMEVLGPIRHYVHEKLDVPLLVTDDDVSGTFTFVRALEEHGFSPDITSEQVGRTWLNQIIEKQTILWWGGRGVSTEHTAYLNLKAGIPAPRSGAIGTNGRTIAEQIGAQIFVDGWAMVAPGRPGLAARLAEQAGRVSHDGESVYAAMVWAAMEAEAFVSEDVGHLLDTGLSFIPKGSAVASMIADVRNWHSQEGDWMKTRDKIEENYGYDKYCGVCHVIPNHGVMVLALLYGGDNFSKAMHIVNTCGWDTDCNSGNVGCLVAIMHGMKSFENEQDWRIPLADRALISSADGGNSITNAAQIALELVDIGGRLAGHAPLVRPKDGAQFHFTLPGSVQGFQAFPAGSSQLRQNRHEDGRTGLDISVLEIMSGEELEILTPTFTGREIEKMSSSYPLMASPLVYPGQTVKAVLQSGNANSGNLQAKLRLKVYGSKDEVVNKDSEIFTFKPGDEKILEWTIPDDVDGQPIQSIGIALSVADEGLVQGHFKGGLTLDSLSWTGVPRMTLRRPGDWSCKYWKQAWVNAVDSFHHWTGPSFCIAKNAGEGIVIHGTREWTDYRVTVVDFTVKLGRPAGVAIRVRGLNRYYGFLFVDDGKRVALVKALDEQRIEMASVDFQWALDKAYEVILQADGDTITGKIANTEIELVARDGQYRGGGLGLVVADGALSADHIKVEPVA